MLVDTRKLMLYLKTAFIVASFSSLSSDTTTIQSFSIVILHPTEARLATADKNMTRPEETHGGNHSRSTNSQKLSTRTTQA